MAKIPKEQQSFFWRYGFAHFGKSLIWIGSEVVFLYYFTVFCGLSSIFAGLILAVSITLNAFMDIVVGYFLSKRYFDTCSAIRLQWMSALLTSSLYLGLFTTTFIHDTQLRIICISVLLIVFKVVFSFYDIAQNSILVIAYLSHKLKINMVGCRLFFSGLAGVSISLIAAAAANLDLLQAQYFYTGSAISITLIAIASAYLLLKSPHTENVQSEVKSIVSDKSFANKTSLLVVFLCANFLFSTCYSFFNKIEPYFISFAINDPSIRWLFMSSVSISVMISQLLWTQLLKSSSSAIAALPISFTLIFFAVAFYYFIDFNKMNTLFFGLFLGAGFGGICSISWNLIILITKNYVQKAIFIGLYTFFSKIGHSSSALIIGIILNTQDYSDISAWDVNSLNYQLLGLIPILSITLYILIYLERSKFDRFVK